LFFEEEKRMSLPRLNRAERPPAYEYPVKVLQIGEGNFIRGFVDWMIHRCNEQGWFQGSVTVTQPRPGGAKKLEALGGQQGLFTLIERGMAEGNVVDRSEVVASISAVLDPYADWPAFLELAENRDVQFVFSNTTEAGIAYREEPFDLSAPIVSFPGKLTAWLYRRFEKLGTESGLVIVPCELLPRPGDALREIVLQHARAWRLGGEFERYVLQQNVFVNSLVDRIVTGYPADAEAVMDTLGYEDRMLTVAEPYHQWVLEGGAELAERLPFHKAGLNVLWVDDLRPYSTRKVRILNGAHTYLVPMAFLQGHDIVRDAVADRGIAEPLEQFLQEAVVPVLPFPEEQSRSYIEQTLERFRNPFIDHRLLDIALNSISKFQTRLLPTLQEYAGRTGKVPKPLALSLAYFIRFHRCMKDGDVWTGIRRRKHGELERYPLRDAEPALAAFAAIWQRAGEGGSAGDLVRAVLTSEAIWEKTFDTVLPAPVFTELAATTAELLQSILDEEGAELHEAFYPHSSK
jgi:tagaturonate reductase